MNIETKIRLKAAGLYMITAIVVVAMLIFLFNLRKNLAHQQAVIAKQRQKLTLTNELIYDVNEAQSAVSLFFTTHDTTHVIRFRKKLLSIDALIDTLSVIEPEGKGKLLQIKQLLSRQASNILALNRLLNNENPITSINKSILQYKPQQNVTTQIANIRRDTLYQPSKKKKGFFRRIKEVFSPEKSTTMVISNVRVDTVRVEQVNPAPVLTDVKKLVTMAGQRYDQKIREIAQQVANQMMSDREISTQVANLLLALHRETLQSMLSGIDAGERSIDRNYTFSIIGSMVALGFILFFILLIIYDVNKGKEAREKLRQVMESRHQLLLSVSHDIKSPLGSILGYLELHRFSEDEIHSMQNSARLIQSLLDNLLEYSSLEQGSLQCSFSTFDLHELGEEINQLFLPLAQAKLIALTCTSDRIRLISDAVKIRQIIINLVSNAVKYTRQGTVQLAMTYVDQQLCIEVKDTGAGIPRDKLNEIYKPFVRIESNNALAHGTGLGMFVVKGLIDLLGGTIRLASAVGEGTSVTVKIPCNKAESKIKQGAKRIAVFDDDPTIVKMAGEMLTRLGHTVTEKDYEMILTDLEMGPVSGKDILTSAGSIPVIVMTGHTDFTLEKALQMGFADFLPKPFFIDSLREIFGEGTSSSDDFSPEADDAVMKLFRSATVEHQEWLKQALADDDFDKAQAVCHKMLPMFTLLGYPTDALRRMDAQRAKVYEGWQKDVETVLSIKI
ncbi:MAG: ATP-binding response regulator [Microbacter sp.]